MQEEKINMDGFEVEELVREAFSITDESDVSNGLTISYNDLIDYTRYLIQLTLTSAKDSFEELQKDMDKNNVYLKNFLNISFLHNYYFYYEEK